MEIKKLFSIFVFLAFGVILSVVTFIFEKIIPSSKDSSVDQRLEEIKGNIKVLRIKLKHNYIFSNEDAEFSTLLSQLECDIISYKTYVNKE